MAFRNASVVLIAPEPPVRYQERRCMQNCEMYPEVQALAAVRLLSRVTASRRPAGARGSESMMRVVTFRLSMWFSVARVPGNAKAGEECRTSATDRANSDGDCFLRRHHFRSGLSQRGPSTKEGIGGTALTLVPSTLAPIDVHNWPWHCDRAGCAVLS